MVKRLNYFDGQFLKAEDFKDEQAYHAGMRRQHNTHLHTWGIAEGGLIPTAASAGATQIKVSPGFAIDAAGNEIVLDHEFLSQDLKASSNKLLFVTIKFSDTSTDAGAAEATRIEMKPIIKVSPEQPLAGAELVLGTVQLDEKGRVATVDTSATSQRRIAGAIGGYLSAISLSLTGLNIPTNMQPSLSVSTGGQVDLNGSLKIDGFLTVSKNAAFAGDLTVTGNVGIGTSGPASQLHVFRDDDAHWSGRGVFSGKTDAALIGTYEGKAVVGAHRADLADWRPLYVNSVVYKDGNTGGGTTILGLGGNVGIGTTAPSSTLHVAAGKGTAIKVNETGELSDDGNFHIHSIKGPIWLNALDGNLIRLNTQNDGGVMLTNGKGRVGIGTDGPRDQLHVYRDDDAHWSGRGVFSGKTDAALIGTYEGQAVVGAHRADLADWRPLYVNSVVYKDGNTGGGTTILGLGGNVGIGTPSPNQKLHVDGDIAVRFGFSLLVPKEGQKNWNAAILRTGYTEAEGDFLMLAPPGHSPSSIRFHTSPGGADVPTVFATEKMRITSGGNVGIGTTNPGAALEISNTNALRLTDNNSNFDSGIRTVHVVGIGQRTDYGYYHASDTFVPVISQLMGNVGIGTNTPRTQLHVYRDDDAHWSGRGVFSGKTDAALIGTYEGQAVVGAHRADLADWRPLYVNSVVYKDGNTGGGTTILGLGGNVGIGTTAPATKLQVNGSIWCGAGVDQWNIRAGVHVGPVDAIGSESFGINNLRGNDAEGITVYKSTDGAFFGLMRRAPADDYFNAVIAWGDNDDDLLDFRFNNERRMYLDSSGNVRAKGIFYSNSADLAENFVSAEELAPGELVSLDADADRIVRSREADDTAVIGIISSAPGFLLNAQGTIDEPLSSGEKRPDGLRGYPVALCGRVPCKVTDENGPIRRGDALSASSKPGHAMRAEPMIVDGKPLHRPGTLVGKALENHDEGDGVIEVFVSLR